MGFDLYGSRIFDDVTLQKKSIKGEPAVSNYWWIPGNGDYQKCYDLLTCVLKSLSLLPALDNKSSVYFRYRKLRNGTRRKKFSDSSKLKVNKTEKPFILKMTSKVDMTDKNYTWFNRYAQKTISIDLHSTLKIWNALWQKKKEK